MFANGESYVWGLLAVPVAMAFVALGSLVFAAISSYRRRNGPYLIFTREFDREIHACDLDQIFVRTPSKETAEEAEQNMLRYETQLAQRRSTIGPQIEEISQRLLADFSNAERADFCITLLVDQSGSLMGDPIILAAIACSLMQDFVTGLGVRCEVLGFTTSTWKGGRSREKWRQQGARPRVVGRLCDLLHIVYKAGDEPGASPGDPIYRQMLRPFLLKENVDGEALEWAVQRLRGRDERHKILIVVSDGAPVDDSTLSNAGLKILERHLRLVIAGVESKDDIKLAALGLGHDVSRYYRDATVITNGEHLAAELAGTVERLMVDRRAP